MFGGTTGGFSFGSSNTSSTPSAAGTLFGAPSAANNTTTTTPSLFGKPASGPTTTNATGSTGLSFGSAPVSQPAPANTTTTSGGFSFGAGNKRSATTLNTASTATTTSAAAPSLFGAPSTTSTASSLFNNPTTTTSTTLFGAPANPSTTGLSFGTGLTNPSSQTVGFGQQQTQSSPAITLKSRFSDLPESLRKNVEELEQFIQNQVQIADTTENSVMDTPITAIYQQCQQLSHRLVGLRNLLERDTCQLETLKKSVMQELRNSDLAIRYLDRLTSTGPPTYMLPSHDAYTNYFNQFADSLEKQMLEYRQILEDLEANLRSRFSAQMQSQQMTPQVVQEIIKSQHESFLSLAKQIAALHDTVEREQVKFSQMEQRFSQSTNAFNRSRIGRTVGGVPVDDVPLSLIASSTLKPMAGNVQSIQPAVNASTTNFGMNPGQNTSLFGAKPTTAPTGSGLFGTTSTATTTASTGFTVPSFSFGVKK